MSREPNKAFRPETIGLIGGSGLMGRMFAPLFEAEGHRVLIAGRSTALGYEALAAQADCVIVTVPIEATVPMIRRIAPHVRPGALLSDFTSVKQEPVAAMLDSRASVIGCHPVFGPMPNVAGQNVVLCPERPGPYLAWYRGFFERNGMRVVEMSPAEHDQAMAVIQGLTHFINVAFARTLQSEHVNIERVLEVCSPVYRMLFAVLSRILSGDPRLYGQIQLTNRENVPVLQALLRNGAGLLETIQRGDAEGFYRAFEEAATYLGDFKHTARDESNFLVEQLKRYLEQRGSAARDRSPKLTDGLPRT